MDGSSLRQESLILLKRNREKKCEYGIGVHQVGLSLDQFKLIGCLQ